MSRVDCDIVFLSYRESNAEENWVELKKRFVSAKRVHGVAGIYEAHKRAAELSETEFFFLVDGDNKILPSFDFDLGELEPRADTIYVWRCLNPINNLKYGYGAVKLYNKTLLVEERKGFRDLATTVARHYHIVHELASETHFHASPEEAWRGAFRECVKLQCQVLENSNDLHSKQRLETWCEYADANVVNAAWVLKGGQMGRAYALELNGDLGKAKALINNFDKLSDLWRQTAGPEGSALS
ncbi:MAG: hypothetical protein HRT45_03835 [Bdellovibrionales bacterium]|nr:hypothetical protein [Bdellovibrionales bacterium]